MVEIQNFNKRLAVLKEKFSKSYQNFKRESEVIKRKKVCDELDFMVSRVEKEYERLMNEEINSSCLATFARIVYLVGAEYLKRKNPMVAHAMAEASKESQPYKDIRILVDSNGVKVVNISKISREKKIPPAEIVEDFKEKGCRILKLNEFKKFIQELKSSVMNNSS